MAGAIEHRGPDDEGLWFDREAGIGFAHRRLAIVDLSPHGHQPMASSDGRWMLCFNGEIYNHLTIRAELNSAGHAPLGGWRGHSDTETLVEAIAAWGVKGALDRSAGMFAFGLWDRRERELILARDRFGEKPLYYGRCGGDLVFGSELKALRLHPEFEPEIDRDALAAFAALTYIPAPRSIYRTVRKLEPGCMMTIAADGSESIESFWSYRDLVLAGHADPFDNEDEALAAIDGALRESLAGQSVADVPVGACLSGGIDSSTVVALYQAISGRPVRTYTIGFAEAEFDEAADARRVADHLDTQHYEYRVGVEEARAVIPMLPSIYDEPFADSSQIPTFLVSKFARADVTVAITGDGGDELFAGYNRHRLAPALWSRLSLLPRPLRSAGAKAAGLVPDAAWNRLSALGGQARSDFGAKVTKAIAVASTARCIDEVYDSFMDEWYGRSGPVRGSAVSHYSRDLPSNLPPIARMTYADAVSYLPDGILVKVDRASMAVSLETRVPFLDHRVAAVAARIPDWMKVRDGKGKWILQRLLRRHVLRELFERPKAGFGVPVGEWIRGPLRDWAESLLDTKRLESEGYFDAAVVRQRWHEHLNGRDSTFAIWAVLMFQAWLEEQR
jgi:asparagine synthase (glutamine-hydrolysing)